MPVDEDLDDLDSVLEEFNAPKAPKASTSKPSPPISKASAAPAAEEDDMPEMDDAFMTELTKNMESLFSNNAANSAGGGDPSNEMKAFLEAMMRSSGGEEGEGGMSEKDIEAAMKEMDASLAAAEKVSGKAGKGGSSFQDTIKKTHEKMNASDASARAEMKASSSSTDPLAALLANLETGLSDDPNLQEALDTMMSQLMSKELLYEPIKDLNEKFPEYLATHSSTLPPDELARYTRQYKIIQQISSKFEDPEYKDEQPDASGELVKLMQDMQSCGAPPKELMGDLPDMNLGADGLPQLPPGAMGDCPQS